MAHKRRLNTASPPNLAARALGSKLFGLKVITPKKGYTRKTKHKKGSSGELPFAFPAAEAA